MTENLTPQPAPDALVEAPAEETESPNREAARYRKQLRDVEAQRDALQNQLTAARTEMLRAAVTGYEVNGDTFNLAAFEDAGIDPDAVFTDDGTLDPDALDTTMQQLAADKPFMFTPPQTLYVPSEGRSPDYLGGGNAWQEAFTAR